MLQKTADMKVKYLESEASSEQQETLKCSSLCSEKQLKPCVSDCLHEGCYLWHIISVSALNYFRNITVLRVSCFSIVKKDSKLQPKANTLWCSITTKCNRIKPEYVSLISVLIPFISPESEKTFQSVSAGSWFFNFALTDSIPPAVFVCLFVYLFVCFQCDPNFTLQTVHLTRW